MKTFALSFAGCSFAIAGALLYLEYGSRVERRAKAWLRARGIS